MAAYGALGGQAIPESYLAMWPARQLRCLQARRGRGYNMRQFISAVVVALVMAVLRSMTAEQVDLNLSCDWATRIRISKG
jgi:hypothetical protein